MMRFKPNAGFTLIEVLLAIAIIGMVLGPLYVAQGNALFFIRRSSDHVHRLSVAKQFLIEARVQVPPDKKDFVLEKQEAIPPVFLRYEMRPVGGKGPFSISHNIYLERVTFTWIDQRGRQTDSIGGFVYRIVKTKETA